MKRFFAIFALVAILFTACESVNNGNTNSALTITSSTNVSVGEGSVIGIITYTINEPTVDLTVEASANVDWINSFDYKDMGKIVYCVDANGTADERTGVVTVSYGNSKATVTITQAGSENPSVKNIEASKVVGHYYSSQIPGYILYYIAFTDSDMSSYEIDPSINYWCVPNAYYYLLYILTDRVPADDKFNIPDGVYELGSGGVMNSINSDTSWYQINREDGFPMSQNDYESAVLTVENGKLTLEASMTVVYKEYTDEGINTTSSEETHIVTYGGDYSLLDMSQINYN